MTFADFLQRRNTWKNEGNHLMSQEEVKQFDDFFADQNASSEYQSDGFTRALVGDFSQFESVEPMMKGYLGAKKCYDLFERYKGNASSPELQQEIKERLMEADLRTGFAFGCKDTSSPIGKFLKDCERIANRQMLMQTLETPEPTAKLRLLHKFTQENPDTAQQKLQETLNADLEQRVEIAKMLFLNHLGKFQVSNSQQQPMDMNENMAEVYAHGGRTMFILPAGADQDRVMAGIQGQHPEQSGLQSRSFATHRVEPRKLNADGSIASEAKELKVRALSAYAPKLHKGMNASIGGLGQMGPHGRMITADGTNGHMYMHLVPGEKNTCGMMLVGFENSGPGEKGRLGHTHDASAKKAGSSAFLSDKSYLGNEIGGRVVDLSGLSGNDLAALLGEFENAYRNAAQTAQTGDSALLDACNDLLTGKPMSVGQMKGMLQELRVTPKQIESVEPARAGLSAKAEQSSVAPEENQPVPMNLAKNPVKKAFRITQFAGLVQPEPPRVMKKPGFWNKVAHFFTFHSKNSYVSRYEEYQKNLPAEMESYKNRMQAYRTTLEALEKGGNPHGLKEAYDRAVEQASAALGIPAERAPQNQATILNSEATTASPEMIEHLETKLLDTLFKQVIPADSPDKLSAEQKTQFLEHIRQTEGFNRLTHSNDANISDLLNSAERFQMLFTDITKGILKNTNQSQPQQENKLSQESKEMAPMQEKNTSNILGS